MNQALHILRKDLYYLRVEVAVFVLLCAVFRWSEPLIPLAAVLLIARAVHADAIPGDHQFWLTRPYNRRSLIAAKLLFVALCIFLPISIAQLIVAHEAGFALTEAIPALLLSQSLLFVFVGLPVVALAALTSGIVPFIVIALILALIYTSGIATIGFSLSGYAGSVPGPVEWIRQIAVALPVAAITIVLLVRQYRWRATASSRIIGIASLSLAALLFVFIPASFALKAQSWFSKQPDLASPVTVTLRSIHQPAMARNMSGSPALPGRDIMSVPFELVADHLPPNTELRIDNFVLSAFFPDRPVKFVNPPGTDRHTEENGHAVFSVPLIVGQPQFFSRLQQPLKIKGSVWLTLFGDDEKSPISLGTPAVIQDGLRCQSNRLADRARPVPPPPGLPTQRFYSEDTIFCISLFQWPRKLVYADTSDSQADFASTRISYAPFAWGLSLDPIEVRWSELVGTGTVTILTRRPLVHFRRDFELTGVKFADFDPLRFMTLRPRQTRASRE